MIDARNMLLSVRAILPDFDGPVISLKPAPLNIRAAIGTGLNGIDPADEIRKNSNHLAIIRWVGTRAPEALPDVEAACTSVEMDAARTSDPIPGAHQLVAVLSAASAPVVIATNNAAVAARTHLERWDLGPYTRDGVVRPEHEPARTNPNLHGRGRTTERPGGTWCHGPSRRLGFRRPGRPRRERASDRPRQEPAPR